MGEDKKAADKDAGGGDKNKDAGATAAIVLKVDLHCAGCASKVRKAIKHTPGVESVAADMAAGKVVVTGPADAAELKERIEARTKKPVQIVSAGAGPPKEKGGGGDKKAAEKPKNEEKKPNEPKKETATFKIRLHCEGCINRVKCRISKIKDVKNAVIEAAKDLVKATGTMYAAAGPAHLREKLISRPMEVVAPGKKDKGDDDKDKGDGGDEKDGGGDEKKDKSLVHAGEMPPHYGYTPYHPAPGGYYDGAPQPNPGLYLSAAAQSPPPSYPYASHVHAPQMFSDENPNACSVM